MHREFCRFEGGDGLGVPYDGAPQLQKTVALAFGARGRDGQGGTQQRNKNVSEGKKRKEKMTSDELAVTSLSTIFLLG